MWISVRRICIWIRGFLGFTTGKSALSLQTKQFTVAVLHPDSQIAYENLPHVGPDHKTTFSCKVTVGESSFEKGVGASKICTRKNAALNVLKRLFDMP